MLAQSFMSAADLGVTEPQRDALQKVLVLLETGKLKHIPEKEINFIEPEEDHFSGMFNMGWTTVGHSCGTVGCIKGNAELISGVELSSYQNDALHELFYTVEMNGRDITTSQAARALRSYLTTGDANWAEAVA